jgi:hypothetical protein
MTLSPRASSTATWWSRSASSACTRWVKLLYALASSKIRIWLLSVPVIGLGGPRGSPSPDIHPEGANGRLLQPHMVRGGNWHADAPAARPLRHGQLPVNAALATTPAGQLKAAAASPADAIVVFGSQTCNPNGYCYNFGA